MQIVAVTDPLQVGFPRQAMIGILRGRRRGRWPTPASMAEVDYVVITAGGFDLLVEVVCEDDDHLLDLVMSKHPGHARRRRSTETFVYLKLRKQLYNWGTR